MALSLKPRHPADIAAESANARRRLGAKKPPPLFRRSNQLALAAIPGIATAIAVYVLLVYVDRLLQKSPLFSSEPPADQTHVRGVDGVVDLPPVVEQNPPPSPELVAEEMERNRASRVPSTPPAPMPVLAPEPLELAPAALPPLTLPTTLPSPAPLVAPPPAALSPNE